MRSIITWTVGRKLAALAGIGLVIAAMTGGVALHGLSNVETAQQHLINLEKAGSLAHALDTRASELKVDAYKAVTLADPSSVLNDLADDVEPPRQLIAELDKLPLDGTAEEQVVALKAGYATYIDDISAFVKAAVANQKAVLPRVGNITRPLGRFVSMLQVVAAGDLSGRLEIRSAGELGTLERALNESVESIGAMLRTVSDSASAVAESSEELSASSQQIAAG